MLELVQLLRGAGFDDVDLKLENAYDSETKVLALTIETVEGTTLKIRLRKHAKKVRAGMENRPHP